MNESAAVNETSRARRSGPAHPTCASCARFVDDPAELELLFRGINALSSAWGSTRGNAGICAVSGRFRDPSPACLDFVARAEGRPA